MELRGKVVVVTGGAGGIGSALARRFHQEGAAGVVVADRDEAGVQAVAAELEAARAGSALGLACDVADAPALGDLLARTEATFGPVDLFCANAGIGVGTDLDTPDEAWQEALDVNFFAHLHAARALVPGWVARGEGYFLATASAAGLLTQIGSGPYAVSKHAAVAFAEWLAITYGDRGVRVSCLCPMGVNTNMLNPPGGAGIDAVGADVVKLAGQVLEPEQVADVVVQALAEERFLILPHPEVATFFQRKASDYDRWLAGMRRLQARVLSG
jgi:NAD(P)-dependent dehydrogenase (short-subunit alcohol dehydrogenase family)